MKITKKEIFSIPNLLGYFRILLIPLFMYVYLTAETSRDYYIAAAIILLSGLTDCFDGKIARKYNMITELGKALDPIADKLTQAAIAVCLMFSIKAFIYVVLVMAVKEGFMLVANLISIKRFSRKLGGAEWFGKVTTALLYALMFVLILFPEMPDGLKNSISVFSMASILITGILYIPVFMKLYKGSYNYKNPKIIKHK